MTVLLSILSFCCLNIVFHPVVCSPVADILELHYMDTSANPCEDFYKYTCGNFGNRENIFSRTLREMFQITKEILSSPIDSDDPLAVNKVKTVYKACVDTDYADELPTPELQLIDEFGGMPLIPSNGFTKFSWEDIGKTEETTGIPQMFQFLPVLNSNYSNWTLTIFPVDFSALKISYSGIVVLLEAILDNLFDNHNSSYSKTEYEEYFNDIINFAKRLEERGDLTGTILPLDRTYTIQQLQDWTDRQFGGDVDINWIDYIGNNVKGSKVNIDENYVISQNLDYNFIYGILNLVKNTNPSIVRNYVLWNIILESIHDSGKSNREVAEEVFELAPFDREEYCFEKFQTVAVSFPIAYVYVRDYFDKTKVPKVMRLIDEVKHAFKTIVRNYDWVDEESRAALFTKVDNIIVQLAYPEFVTDKKLLDDFYDRFEVSQWNNYDNSRRIRLFSRNYSLNVIVEQRNFWRSFPMDVNAYGSPDIAVPAGILHDNFFTGNNPVWDYSRLGSIIAHELTHIFDNDGIIYNQVGHLNLTWISNTTIAAFNEQTKCLIEEYNNYSFPEINEHLNGTKTLGENIADNGGVRKAFLAFQRFIQDKEIYNPTQNFTLEQLFFITHSTMWCNYISADELKNVLKSHADLHSPMQIRTIGALSNFEEFSKAFNCSVGSQMNREQKCTVW